MIPKQGLTWGGLARLLNVSTVMGLDGRTWWRSKLSTCEACGGTGEVGEFSNEMPSRKRTREAAKEGMSAAERHANVVWKGWVRYAIRELAATNPTFSSDDVRVWMRTRKPDVQTHNKSALGPLLVAAAKKGLTESIGTMRSELPVTHGKHITIWGSLIYVDLPD